MLVASRAARNAVRVLSKSPTRPSAPSRVRTMASASADASFNKTDKRRMLHAVFRVGDQPASAKFFQQALGLKETRFRDVPEGSYSNGFYAYGPEEKNFALETTYNYGVDSYDIGEGFGHFGVATKDVAELADRIRKAGGTITREPGPVKGGTTVIAFAKDPTGYMWELIERKNLAADAEPLCQVMLRVTDLDASIKYYTEVLGMRLLRTRVNEEHKYTLAFVGYEDEDKGTVIELTYNHGRGPENPYKPGNAYAQVAISTDDVYKSAEAIKAAGGKVTREPGPVPGIGTKILATVDPDGYKYVLVDNADFLEELK